MENKERQLNKKFHVPLEAAREIAFLEKSCFPEDYWSLEAVTSSLERADILYGFEYSEGKAIGYFLAAASFEECELYRIGVLKEHRGQGKGKALIKSLLRALPPETERVYLEVRESNKGAIGLYESMGFKKAAERKNYYGNENGLVYILDTSQNYSY